MEEKLLASAWSIGFQHPTYGYSMSASLRIDEETVGAYVCDEMSYDRDLIYIPEARLLELEALCKKWTGRFFYSLDDMVDAFKSELGLSRSDVV